MRKNVRDGEGNIVEESKNWVVTSFDNNIPKSKKKRSPAATRATPDGNEGGRAVTPGESSDGKGSENISDVKTDGENRGDGQPEVRRREMGDSDYSESSTPPPFRAPEEPADMGAMEVEAGRISEVLGVPIEVHTGPETVNNSQVAAELAAGKRVGGWFEKGDNGSRRLHLYLPGMRGDMTELRKTIVHEVVAHYGLESLLGEAGYRDICRSVFKDLSVSEKNRWLGYSGVSQSKDPRAAAGDEYIASVAERMLGGGKDVTDAELGLWRRFVSRFRELVRPFMERIGYRMEWTENDIAALVARSAKNLREDASYWRGASEGGEDGESRLAVRGDAAARERDDITNRAMRGGYHMKAPDGTTSRLNEKQWAEVRTQNFKQWAGDWETDALYHIAQKSFSDKGYQATYRFATTERLNKRLTEILGHPIYGIIIESSRIRHINDHHGNKESLRGQRDITPEDIAFLPYLFDNFDAAIPNPKYNDALGNRAVDVIKRVNGLTIVGTIERGKNRMAVATNFELRKSDAAMYQNVPELYVRNDSDIAKVQQEIETRKKNLGNSTKVVGENGEPLVVYHGTKGQEYYWKDGHPYTRSVPKFYTFKSGFFTSDYEAAKVFADGAEHRVYATYLDIKRPLEIDAHGDSFDAIRMDDGSVKSTDLIIQEARENGNYDGVIIRNVSGESNGNVRGTIDDYIPFSPEQIKSATENNGDFSRENPDTRFSVRDGVAPTFYSNAERAVEQVKQDKAKGEQWLAMLRKSGGIKAGEDKWMGLSDWLEEHKGETLTREQVLEFVRANGVKMEEVDYSGETGDTSPYSYLQGDNTYPVKDFPEYTFTYKTHAWGPEEFVLYRGEERIGEYNSSTDMENALKRDKQSRGEELPISRFRRGYQTKGLRKNREIAFVVPSVEPYQQGDPVHFGPENAGRAVMWVRFGEATDADGKRVLVIDEVQSNRHQDAREKGYQPKEVAEIKRKRDALRSRLSELHQKKYNGGVTEEENKEYYRLDQEDWDLRVRLQELIGPFGDKSIPDAPFEKNWHEVVMKRMLRLAAEEGFDKVAWTTGEQQAERYGIGGVVKSITKGKTRGENTLVSVQYRNGKRDSWIVAPDGKVVEGGVTTGENLSDLIGKELSERVMSLEENGSISGDGLRIGGEGMKAFYDGMLPSFMKKYVKKWGSGVGEVKLTTPGGEVMHSVDVTDAMKRSVMEEGQTLFRLTGAERERVERDNERFNSELDKQIRGELPSGHVYKMGIPSSILRSAGFPEQEIELAAKRLTDKSAQHGFNIDDVRDLAAALQEPVAVFSYGDKDKAQNVIVEIMRDGHNFVVGVHFNQTHRGIEVSDIRGLFPKDNAEWLNWITQGKMLYVDKEKIQTIIAQQRTTPAEVDYLDLDSVAKIVENFENPPIPGENNAETTESGEETRFFVRDEINDVLGSGLAEAGRENEELKRERERANRVSHEAAEKGFHKVA